MRIYDRDLTGTTAADTGRASETTKTDRDATATSSQTASNSGDRVELSSGLAGVSRALASFASDRAAQVQQLAAQFQSGNYQPNSLATGQGIVAQALAGAQ